MKFILTKTSDWHFKEEIEVETLEDIIKLARDNNTDLVISLHEKDGLQDIYPLPEIEIYDTWRE